MVQRTVLLTGAAGNVAQLLIPGLADYSLRLADRTDPSAEVLAAAGSSPDVQVGDLCDVDVADQVVKGVDTVVHLAANPGPRSSWHDLRAPNVELVVTVLEAAQRAD